MASWRTTAGGVLAALGAAMRHVPELAPYADVVSALGVAIIGLSARDNKVSSEQAGAK